MPSAYCVRYPNNAICAYNPDYNGGFQYPTGGGGGEPTNNPTYFPPVGSGGASGGGTGTVNQGGGTWGSGTYTQTLQAILGGIALFQHQPYIPTTIQPVQQQPYGYGQQQYGYGQVPAQQNVAGSLQTLVQQHPTAILAGVVLIGALLLKPPVQRSR